MHSWRDRTSQEAQADLDALLNAALPFALQTLSRHSEFYPFAAEVTLEGDLGVLGPDGTGGQPQPGDVLHALYTSARESSASRRAVTFAAWVDVNGSDTIRIELEHREGMALTLLVPYSRRRMRKSVTLGEISAGPGERRVWPKQAP